jgi:putative drug exporter of the RND superfamily
VNNVVSYRSADSPLMRSRDTKMALVVATLVGDQTAVGRRLDELLPRYEGERDGLDVTVGGYARFEAEAAEQPGRRRRGGDDRLPGPPPE